MNACLKNIISPDIEDLETFQPADEEFCYLIQALIGLTNGLGEESFDFLVCSPKWLIAETEKEKLLYGRVLIIMNDFDYSSLKESISSLCRRTSGNSWHEIANSLSGFGIWEFEDYK